MRAAAVLVNWNGWADTLECLESVLRMHPRPHPVVVCDNGSTDYSAEQIRSWAAGRLNVWVPPTHSLRHFSYPPVPKPLEYVEYPRSVAEAGGSAADRHCPLVLIQTGENLGYAAGNNVGLRYLLARGDCDAFWLLNNDTVVAPDALEPLLQRLQTDSTVGMVGSTLLFYSDPATVQVQGGPRFNPWLALPGPLGLGRKADALLPEDEINSRLAFVAGASMMLSRTFVERVGLMSEDYFLYFEELDWVVRARGRFVPAYAADSVVYHKEGGSIGSGSRDSTKNWISDYHFLRNRVRFTRRWQPAMLPFVYLSLGVALLRRAGRGQWRRIPKLARAIWDG